MNRHVWSIGRRQAHSDLTVNCHRNLRGPYTGVGSVLRALVPRAVERTPELVREHVIAILSLAPELRGTVEAGPETLTSLAVPKERTRIYPANRARRLAHGAFEFINGHLAATGSGPFTLTFRDVDEADHSDQEFLAIALRRARDSRLVLVVQTHGETLPDELASALEQYATREVAPPEPVREDTRTADELLRAYINADGTSRDPAEERAYRAADPAVVAALHDERAAELTATGEFSLRLGAIPYHLEHGTDPMNAGGEALYEAAKYCGGMGFYHAILDIGPRGVALTDPEAEMERYWLLSTRTSTALLVLGRSVEAEPTYLELRSKYALPELHMSTGYALTMIYTRFHPAELKDHHLAKGYINNAIAIASQLPDPNDRAFHTVFQQNGLALVETHLGNLPEALRLVTEGEARLARELPGDKHRLHRSVLVHNRGKVLAGLGRLEEALADFSTVIELDPNYPDYYFDRADVRRKLGDLDGALADYDTATTLTEPFYELHYNRADLLIEMGDLDAAARELSYVLDLEPDQLDARVNLISVLLDTGAADAARDHIVAGLRLHPGEVRLLHASGLLAQLDGDLRLAKEELDRALDIAPDHVASLAARAALAFDAGDHAAAVADLDAALGCDADNPDLLYNRGFVHQAAGDFARALRDYTRALVLPGADEPELLRLRAVCEAELVGSL